MRRALYTALTALVVFLAASPPAHSLAMPEGDAKALYESWLSTSALPTPDAPISVILENCDARHAACTDPMTAIHFPDIAYLATSEYAPAELAMMHGLFMHEVGHVIDTRLGGEGGRKAGLAGHYRRDYRREFKRIMHGTLVGGGEACWWTCGLVPDSEAFADAYAYCAVSPHAMPRDQVYRGYDVYRPTDRQHNRVCHMLSQRLTSRPTRRLPKRKASSRRRRPYVQKGLAPEA